ncbi:MAG: hypothetical protein GXO07_06080 [Crenarchaeota archaeon]|nr:hypothetical protein [Thermoproteota archaeon]
MSCEKLVQSALRGPEEGDERARGAEVRPGIVYGRRRIGKTRLLLEWLKKRKGIFWEAFVGSYEELSKSFAEAVRKEAGIYVPHDVVEALKVLNDFDFAIVLD